MKEKWDSGLYSFYSQAYPSQLVPYDTSYFLPVDYRPNLANDVIQCAIDRPCITGVYNVGANLIVEWSDTENRDHYNFRWSRPGKQEKQIELAGGRGGRFTLRNFRPNTRYTFKVQGCYKPILAPSRCTPWEEITVISCGAPGNPCR